MYILSPIQAQEQDVNIKQGSMLYLDNKNVCLSELMKYV